MVVVRKRKSEKMKKKYANENYPLLTTKQKLARGAVIGLLVGGILAWCDVSLARVIHKYKTTIRTSYTRLLVK